jgi:Domain of unknown function (DUF4389)
MIDTGAPEISVGSPSGRPSRLGYWLAAILLAVALTSVALAVAGFVSLDRQIRDFQRVPVPGRAEVTFTQPGRYVLYVEKRAQCCGFSFAIGDGPFARWSLTGSLRPLYGSAPVAVSDWHGAVESYRAAGHQGQTALSFTIPRPGSYLLTIRNMTPGTVADLAVGRGILAGIVEPPLLALAGIAVLIAAGVLFGITASRRRPARAPGPGAGIPGGDLVTPARVEVGFAGAARQRRATVAVRIVLAIPQLICLAFVRYAVLIVLVIGWFCALITGRLPDSIAEFLVGFQQWEVRLSAYLLLLTDAYPPFGWRDSEYPVTVAARPGRLNRFAVLFRVIIVVPAWLVWDILAYGLGMIMMFAVWLIVLIMGRMPQPLHEALAAILRYWARLKGYWYMLTDVYPAGLFGDQPEPVTGGEVPSALALLPADHVGAPAAATGVPSAAPGPLVLSRPARGLVGLTLGMGVIAPFALFFAQFALAPAAGPSPRTVPPAASAVTPGANAPAPHSTASAPPTKTEQWVTGLRSLRNDMLHAMRFGTPITVTAASLRSDAMNYGRCPSELAALGPPPAQLRQVYRQASNACRHFKRGAACYAAAAKAFSYSPAANKPGAKFPRLLDCGDAAIDSGASLIDLATSDASLLQTPD